MTVIDAAIQPLLPLVSLTCTYLISRRRLSGIVMSLGTQPLWLFTACVHRQWGIAVTTLLNTACMVSGLPEWLRGRTRPDERGAPDADEPEADSEAGS